MLPLGTLSLGLWVVTIDPAFIACHQSIKNCGVWIDQLEQLPTFMTTSFFPIFPENSWDKLHTNLPHLQFQANNCVYSSHSDIKRCTYCLYRHTTVLIHTIFYLGNQLWCSDFLTPLTPLIIPHRLSAFLESLMLLKNWCSIHARRSKSSLKHSIRFCCIFPSLTQNFIAYHSSKLSSRPDCNFYIHQLWQPGFSRVYSNCCCSCLFEPEIIKIDQAYHTMYSNNIVNFQESTTILNAFTEKSGNLLNAPRTIKQKTTKRKKTKPTTTEGLLDFVLSLRLVSSSLKCQNRFSATSSLIVPVPFTSFISFAIAQFNKIGLKVFFIKLMV